MNEGERGSTGRAPDCRCAPRLKPSELLDLDILRADVAWRGRRRRELRSAGETWSSPARRQADCADSRARQALAMLISSLGRRYALACRRHAADGLPDAARCARRYIARRMREGALQ